jgi:hypothetical protein
MNGSLASRLMAAYEARGPAKAAAREGEEDRPRRCTARRRTGPIASSWTSLGEPVLRQLNRTAASAISTHHGQARSGARYLATV